MINTEKLSEAVREALNDETLWLKAEKYIAKRNAEVKAHFDKVTAELQQVTCLTCDTVIKRDFEWSEGYPIHEAVMDEGTVNTFSCGFGSRYDMNTYIIGICDNCLEKFIEQQKAIRI